MKRDLRLEETYPYPPERIWRALTDSEAMADWLMPNTFEPRIGHRFQFRTKPRRDDGIVSCSAGLDPRNLAYVVWWRRNGAFSAGAGGGGTRLPSRPVSRGWA